MTVDEFIKRLQELPEEQRKMELYAMNPLADYYEIESKYCTIKPITLYNYPNNHTGSKWVDSCSDKRHTSKVVILLDF